MFEQKKLHPITILYNIFRQLKEIIFPVIAIFVFGGTSSKWDFFYHVGLIVFSIFVLVGGVLSWFFFRYYLHQGELRIENGVFVKKKRFIPFERIQSIDFTEGILHRPFGLVKVKIETAGGAGEAEAVLTAIHMKDAIKLRDYINKHKNQKNDLEDEILEENKQELYKITTKELLILATTSGGIGVVFSALIAVISQFDDLIPYKKIFREFQHVVSSGMVVLTSIVFILFILLWIVSFLITVLKYANFTIAKIENDLVVSRGLLEKKQITIPLSRIQAVRIRENILRQPFGLAAVYLESAGGSLNDNEASSMVIMPVSKKVKIKKLLLEILPDYELVDDLHAPPKKARFRYMLRDSWIAVPIAGLSFYYFHLWGIISIVLFVLLPSWGYLKYRAAGWGVTNKQLTISFRHLEKTTLIMKKNRIQALDYKEGFWQRGAGLASLSCLVASGIGGSGGTVYDLRKEEIDKVYNWYSYSVKK
ncbi:PH domain-containing protein [Niallia nealsonii]|uniref:YdbS-like PH domain-containing protein n=1 Tax=Niallia nealsonii TaxID=115979 RepID=A0A2N0Z2D3_9BACI|nr:PH domain-containing protein [Niallia nealsonii]PKG23683.1 hypothetical protein CWS01_10700 [Niallia nealsonii]